MPSAAWKWTCFGHCFVSLALQSVASLPSLLIQCKKTNENCSCKLSMQLIRLNETPTIDNMWRLHRKWCQHTNASRCDGLQMKCTCFKCGLCTQESTYFEEWTPVCKSRSLLSRFDAFFQESTLDLKSRRLFSRVEHVFNFAIPHRRAFDRGLKGECPGRVHRIIHRSFHGK